MNNPPVPSLPNQDEDIQARTLAAINVAKIPDTIKTIPEYSGDTKSLKRWIDHVDTVLATFQQLDIPIFDIWVSVIRFRIIGVADHALNASGCPNNWAAIKTKLIENFGDKKNLQMTHASMKISMGNKNFNNYYLETTKLKTKITKHYGDKRNLQTIFAAMRISIGNKNLNDYYLEATKLINDIEQIVSLDPIYDGYTPHVMRFANIMVTCAFIDGMPANLKSFVMAKGAKTLAEAKRFAEEWQNTIEKAKKFQEDSKTKYLQNFKNNQNKTGNKPRNFAKNLQNSRNFRGSSQSFPQILPQNFHNHGYPQNIQESQPPKNMTNAQNFQAQNNSRAFEEDFSMRSRRSNISMLGISYRSNAINNNETEETLEHYNEDESEEEELNFKLCTQINL